MVQIGKVKLPGNLVLSPMAGVSDAPYRYIASLCGASYTICEMITSQLHLWSSYKTQNRLNDLWEPSIKIMQIAGASPEVIVDAAIKCEELGAAIIEINMGCPAKKVCNVLAGSALLKDEELVKKILQAVTKAVAIPVILKTRLGWNGQLQNIETIAQIAQEADIKALTVHGRTRDQLYNGHASYDLIAQVKQKLNIPVFANGDIDSPEKAKEVLNHTQADGLYIGRAAMGNPWIFKQIQDYLTQGSYSANNISDKKQTMILHLECIFLHYPQALASGYARKHIKWYLAQLYNKDYASLMFKQFINLHTLEEFIERINLNII
jgi:tRNA-dihydrouridine synthase B